MRFVTAIAIGSAILGLSSGAALAQDAAPPHPSVRQCIDLVDASKLAEAEPACAQAAKDDPLNGRLLYAQYLHLYKKDPRAAFQEYVKLRAGLRAGQHATELQLAGLRGVALTAMEMGPDNSAAIEYLKFAPNDTEVLAAAANHDMLSSAGEPVFADKLIELEPKAWQPHVMRSRTLIARGRPADALVAAQRAVALAPKEPVAVMQRGEAYEANEKYDEAVRDYVATSALAPNEPRIHIRRGLVLFSTGKLTEAIEAASSALKIKSDLAEALELRAASYLRMGQAELALADVAAGQKAEAGRSWRELRGRAEELAEVQKTITARTASEVAADKAAIVEAFQAQLQRTCGLYSQGYGQEWLDQFNACSRNWRNTEVSEENLPSGVQAAAERLNEVERTLDDAEKFTCASMPARSRCIEPQWIAGAQAHFGDVDDNSDFLRLARNAEVQRINRGVESNNASIRTQNRVTGFANFMSAVAEALAEQ